MADTNQTGREILKKRNIFRVVIPRFPAFNIYSGIARVTTALGPVSIATIADKMDFWDVEVIDENNFRRFGPKDVDGRPDHEALQKIRPAHVVGFYGGLTSTIPRLYELAGLYRKMGVKTVAGGQHFTGENIAEGLNNGIDVIVIGEGEETIKELLEAYALGADISGIPGIAYLRDGKVVQTRTREPLTDFDRIPVPDFSLLRYAKLQIYPVGWVRGCCMQCEFCTVKGKVRCPAPEYVVQQITSLVERQDARKFFIVDDLFGQNRAETLRLCEMVRTYQKTVKVRLSITVQIRLDKARDAELLQAMRGAGIDIVAIGFESPIPEELRAMNKKTDPAEMLELTQLFRDAGFLVHGMFIFGYPIPGATGFTMPAAERVRRFRSFIRKARIDTVQILLPVPLPGTEMTERLARENRIYPRSYVGWEYYDGNFPLFEPDKPLTAEEMQACLRKIMGRFYRFKHMFSIGINVLVFPAIIFWLHNIRAGWNTWYREWRNDILRFGGWIILRRWTNEFNKGIFSAKLKQARRFLVNSRGASG